ncbi:MULTISPECIES: glycosyltransferase family 25 protein [unclassified Rhizobium]|uniref:glycosyltransferase family 25 protein n=1 Tax=unclassified Rhizobium TaxID=2613769 RepID=UPI001ADAEB72|nr:glycosyltransferase family 25 protein [Rhizobium sp. 16-488-2b]MBO9177535.1 glycosyltransferase family 25 protein [Rhizobium sp. 16-488-2a]
MRERQQTESTADFSEARRSGTGETLSRRGIVSYVINLDRSLDRWQHIKSQADEFGLDVQRIPGVEIDAAKNTQWPDYDRAAFMRGNGRPMLPQEYGCYLAHVKALNAFLESAAECAVIMEDDVNLSADLVSRAYGAHQAAPFAEVIKLLNHRVVWFRPIARSSNGDVIGKCLFGPQGSAACYLVTRAGARKLVDALKVITCPYDIALERGWATGVKIYTLKDDLITLSVRSKESQIADRARYRSIKLRGLRKIPTHIWRMVELFRRVRYAVS